MTTTSAPADSPRADALVLGPDVGHHGINVFAASLPSGLSAARASNSIAGVHDVDNSDGVHGDQVKKGKFCCEGVESTRS